ncbi:(2Fe-2S)-binding protein [Photobacterium atrarenae]|uniref:(2Fe-2S)-binding protein n=1 Tax=Photobacterium atrarenae TaxID=865757 RepID=A0ABY5GNG2_9GAMM|nr:(2Fe-2S)-binding protein [Photobacterium atrarenae]UTV30629.1 (2Fe-2S)-binding protein [Photobacterium atrarenae]
MTLDNQVAINTSGDQGREMQSRFEHLLPLLMQVESTNDKMAQLNPAWTWDEVNCPDSLSLEALLAGDWIADQIQAFQVREQAPTRKVAATLVQKRLMATLLSPLVAHFVVTGYTPLSPARPVAFDPLCWQVGWHNGSGPGEQEDFLSWLDHVTQRFFALFRHQFGVAPQVFWGNCALAIASPWSQLNRFPEVDGRAVHQDVSRFFSELSPSLQSGLEWLSLEVAERHVCVPRRRSCCLKYTLPGAENKLCGTCNRRSAAEQTQLVVANLTT